MLFCLPISKTLMHCSQTLQIFGYAAACFEFHTMPGGFLPYYATFKNKFGYIGSLVVEMSIMSGLSFWFCQHAAGCAGGGSTAEHSEHTNKNFNRPVVLTRSPTILALPKLDAPFNFILIQKKSDQ